MRKYVFSFISVLMLMSIMCSSVFALSEIGIDPTPGIEGNGASVASKIIGIMQWCGYAIAVGVMVYIGIKYVISSADDKASLKGAAWKYAFGAFLVVCATTIVGWIFK